MVNIEYNRMGKPAVVVQRGVGSLRVTYQSSGEISKVDSDGGDASVAVSVAAKFNNLLDLLGVFSDGIEVDNEFDLITAEPGGCRECSSMADF